MKIYRQVICKQFHTLLPDITRIIVILKKHLADVDHNGHIVDSLMYGYLLLTYFFPFLTKKTPEATHICRFGRTGSSGHSTNEV